MDSNKLSLDEIQALTAAKLSDVRKELNSQSWNDNMENLMKHWGEKAAGLRFMHEKSSSSWKKFADRLSLSSIFITCLASSVSLIATNIEMDENKNIFLYTIGGIGLLSTLLQSLKKFYNAEEKAADHFIIAKQYGSYYRNLTLQLGMTRHDRDSCEVLTNWALKEYERLQQDSPSISGNSIQLFKDKFKNKNQAFPDIAEDQFIINIFNNKNNKPVKDNNEKIENKDIELVSTN